MDFLQSWPIIVMNLFLIFMVYLLVRRIFISEYTLKILKEDSKEYFDAVINGKIGKNPYRRCVKMSELQMFFEFWVWPLSRYLPKEEADESNPVSS